MFPFRRICVVGTSGAGKTTMAARLARLIDAPHVELDALYWDAGWTAASDEVFAARVTQVVGEDRWVVDGNYGKARSIIWPRVQLVVWLDYSLPVVMRRVVGRTAGRLARHQELWNGNRESLREALSRDSIVVWALKTHVRRRRELEELLVRAGAPGIAHVRLRSPREARRWVRHVAHTVTESTSAS